MVAGRIHFGISNHEHRSIQGDFRRRGDQQLDDVLREHGYYAFHAAVPARDAVGRPGDLSEDFADEHDQAGEDADIDPVGQRGQACAGA